MAEPKGEVAKLASSQQLRELATSLTLHAYDNHKLHARFQESQRSLAMAGFITFSSALLTLLGSPNFHEIDYRTEMLMIVIHLVFCALTGIAITKMSRERGRHFRQAEKIVQTCSTQLKDGDKELVAVLGSAELETLAYSTSGSKRLLIRFLSVSAVFNYFIAMFAAIDLALISERLGVPAYGNVAIALTAFVTVAYAQHRYSRWLAG